MWPERWRPWSICKNLLVHWLDYWDNGFILTWVRESKLHTKALKLKNSFDVAIRRIKTIQWILQCKNNESFQFAVKLIRFIMRLFIKYMQCENYNFVILKTYPNLAWKIWKTSKSVPTLSIYRGYLIRVDFKYTVC